MVDVAPFRALRFATKKKNDVTPNICPPYDVISPEERAALARKYPHNVIHLELPAGDGDAKYANAARVLADWRRKGILKDDEEGAFYLLETVYRISDPFAPKGRLKRYGVLSGLRLETPGKGSVKPHEKTLPKAKEDRLKLLTAVRTTISPIFGLFFDKGKKWPSWISRATKREPLVVGKEHRELTHRLWKIDDPKLQAELRRMLSAKDLYIADGHHRYEVSFAYSENRLKNEAGAPRSAGWRRVMAYICPMEEKGLLMLPTHRLVTSSRTLDEWRLRLESVFTISPVRNMKAVLDALRKSRGGVIGWSTAEGHHLLKVRKDISIDRCLPHRPKALRALDVVVLHDLALGEAPEGAAVADREIVFTRDIADIEAQVKDRSKVAFLLASPGVASLARVAQAGEVMPPKTTYFYPKVPTGMTLMPLDQTIG